MPQLHQRLCVELDSGSAFLTDDEAFEKVRPIQNSSKKQTQTSAQKTSETTKKQRDTRKKWKRERKFKTHVKQRPWLRFGSSKGLRLKKHLRSNHFLFDSAEAVTEQ